MAAGAKHVLKNPHRGESAPFSWQGNTGFKNSKWMMTKLVPRTYQPTLTSIVS